MPRFVEPPLDGGQPEHPSSKDNPTKSDNIQSGVFYSFMESVNYEEGESGWKIDGQGNMEVNNIIARGQIEATTGEIGGFTISQDTISKDKLTLSSQGYIGIDASQYNDEGIWIGDDSGTPKLSLYKDSDNYLNFDGNTIDVAGRIEAGSGSIGNLDINGNLLMTGSPWIRSSDSVERRFSLEGGNDPKLIFQEPDGSGNLVDRMTLDSRSLQFVDEDNNTAGEIRGESRETQSGEEAVINIDGILYVQDAIQMDYDTANPGSTKPVILSRNSNNDTFSFVITDEVANSETGQDEITTSLVANSPFIELRVDDFEADDAYIGFKFQDDLVAYIDDSGSLVTPSDIRYKTEVNPIEETDFLYKITPISFIPQHANFPMYGLSAQEVAKHNDVLTNGSDETRMSIKYMQFIPLLIKEMQNLNERISQLEK